MLTTHPSLLVLLQDTHNLLLVGGLAFWIASETIFPLMRFKKAPLRLKHLFSNAMLWIVSSVLLSVLVGGYIIHAQFWLEYNGIGLLHLIDLPVWLLAAAGVLLIDFGDYVFHRLSHRIRWLWLLHAVHHSDEHLDVSTSLRAHPFHVVASFAWKILLIASLGVPIWVAMARDALAIPVNQFHHSNIRLPDALERWLRWIIITPPVHRIHHAPQQPLTDSNFGGLFPWWDRLLGTYFDPEVARPPRYGLEKMTGPAWQTLWGMLVSPWRVRRLEHL